MITIYKSTERGLQIVEAPVRNTWVHVTNPDERELSGLRREFDIPDSFIAAALDVDELARSDKEDDATLIILLIPHEYSDPTDVPYSTVPLGIILLEDHVVTICHFQTGFVGEYVARLARPVSTAKRNRLVLHLFAAAAQRYMAYLRHIDTSTDAVQRKLESSLKNRELMALLRYQKSLTYFRTGLESNWLMMRRLRQCNLFDQFPEDEELLEDVLTENEQAMEMTKIASDILSAMMDAYASIISNNLNDVMKILAVATIILSIPTVLASFYGMNVALPGADSPAAFFVILSVSALLAVIALVIFWRRDWL
jgi:magnesium transporter